MNKQIEQMARVTCQMYTRQYEKRCAGVGECDYKCLHYQRCEALYDMGYRKASDVAREIIGEIEKINKQYRTTIASVIIGQKLAELKKKYESEGEE